MNLFDKISAQLPFSKKTVEPEYFFALAIGLSEVTAAVWEICGKKLDVVGKATISYHGTDDLVEKAYQALDHSLGALEIEPQKVLFGIPDSWSVDDDLKEPYLKLLRRMLKEYDLEPLAYVSNTNALAFFLQKQEGIPPTAITLGIGGFVEMTLLRGGKAVESRAVERSGTLFDDIARLLDHFNEAEVLPSKILLYSTKEGENLGKIRDELMSYHWMQKLPFLHFPKIDVLGEGIIWRAVILAGASEMNPRIDFKHGFVSEVPSVSLDKEDILESGPVSFKKTVLTRYPEPGSTKKEVEKVSRTDETGFVRGDISQMRPGIRKEQEEAELLDDNLVSPDLPEGEDRALLETDQEYLPVQERGGSRAGGLQWWVGHRLGIHFSLGLLGKWLLLPGLLFLAGLFYLLMIKAVVTIYVEPKILEEDAEIIADPESVKVDEEKKIIPGSIVETTVSGGGKIQATGQKQIGDSAKGTVIIYNAMDSVIKLATGAILASDNGLKFQLDSSVQLASKSASAADPPSHSSSVGATAVDIGPDGNILGGTELKVGNYTKSDVVAKVDQAFSGGTSKNITVVTADDQKKLKAKVLDELKQKAEGELQSSLPSGKKIIADAFSAVDGKYTFSKQVNDQASEFSLSANVRFKGTAYVDADLRTIVGKLVQTNVPTNFELNLQSTETQADVAKVEKDGRLVFRARFRAKLLPKFDLTELKKQIKGKSVSEAAARLKELDNVIGSEVRLKPSAPAKIARLPFLERNIEIVVTPK